MSARGSSAGAVSDAAAGDTAVVRARGLGVLRGGQAVLHGVDLRVDRGDWVSVVGPNGAGKTTLLHVLAGLLPTLKGTRITGELAVGGLDPLAASRREMSRVVALMPQRPVVPEGVTVAELIALGRTPHLPRFGVESAADRDIVREIIERLDLGELAGRQATHLSGGELQRVVLGRALAQQPQVLLLDEPTSALDIGHQQQVLELVESMRAADGITVVAAMHDLTLASQYGRRMLMMADGAVVADGPANEVLRADRIAEVYGARVEVLERGGLLAVLPLRAPVVLAKEAR